MNTHVKILAALVLGLALTGAMGAGVVLSGGNKTPSTTQDNSNTGDLGLTDSPLVTDAEIFCNSSDPESMMGDVPQDFLPAPDGSGQVAIALGARWGYLNDPTLARLDGQWHLINQTAGGFRGQWQAVGSRAHGYLFGDFGVAPGGGHGRFMGTWGLPDGRVGGSLGGLWQWPDNASPGIFQGRWNTTDGKQEGGLKGMLKATDRGSGVFGGLAIRGPTIDMVPWDGFLQVSDGKVKLFREVRFEHGGNYSDGGDDKVLPQRDNTTLAWRSSTTTNWDGLIMGILVPNGDVQVTFHTEQWSKTFTARELINLHIRVPVDRLGHEIELRGFLIRPPRPPCPSNFVKVSMTLTWGYLGQTAGEGMNVDPTGRGDTYTPWSGFVQVTKGGVVVRELLNWERGGTFENGTGDFVYPRNNMLTVEWQSSVTNDWDGLVVMLCLPLRGEPQPHVTIHTDQWTNVYGLDELRGLDETYEIPRIGQAIHVEATVS